MKRILLLTAALLAAAPAYAENWQTIDVMQNGTIVEANLDSIQHAPASKNWRILASMGGSEEWMVFDCAGHYTMGNAPMIHIPHNSIAAAIELVTCISKPVIKELQEAEEPTTTKPSGWGRRNWGKNQL